ncbi:MAG: Crp/Fnr family transcriptional regulator [Pseudomonadota bacterium]
MNKKLDELSLMALRRCLLLKDLEQEQFLSIAAISHLVELGEHESLFLQGDELSSIYLLISGNIKLFRLTPSGNEKIIDLIRPGQTFAEAALFMGGSRYPVNATAVSSSVVVAIDARGYKQTMESSVKLCMNLLARMSSRLHWMVNEVDRLTLHNATFRLIDFLLNQVVSEESSSEEIHLDVPKHVIASRLSMKPETLSRTLKQLVQRKLIRVHDSHVELLDVKELRDLIQLECQ